MVSNNDGDSREMALAILANLKELEFLKASNALEKEILKRFSLKCLPSTSSEKVLVLRHQTKSIVKDDANNDDDDDKSTTSESSSSSSSSSSSCSSSDSNTRFRNSIENIKQVKVTRKTTKTEMTQNAKNNDSSSGSSSSDNDSDSSSDDEDGKQKKSSSIGKTKEKEQIDGDDGISSGSSSSDSDTDSKSSSSDDDDNEPPKKKSKMIATKKTKTEIVVSPEEDDDSDSDVSDVEVSSVSTVSTSEDESDSDSDSSSDSSSSSDSEEEDLEAFQKAKRKKATDKANEAAKAALAWTPKKIKKTKDDIKTHAGSDGAQALSAGKPFQRVDDSYWGEKAVDHGGAMADNSYENVFGNDGFGAKASEKLLQVRGKRFQHEKTKRKRSFNGMSRTGGKINMESNSTKYKYD